MPRSIIQSLFRHFPTPKALSMPAVGFEVTPEAVRCLELIDAPHGKRVGRFGERRLTPSDVKDDTFPDGERLKRVVTELMEEQGVRLIASALPDEKVYLFTTEMPKLEPREILAGIEVRLEESVPVPVSEAVFDYESDGLLPDKRMSISVSVAPRLVVSRYVDFFKTLGLVPMSLQVSSQAAARAIVPVGYHAPVIIVNVGRTKTTLSIVSYGAVRFTSVIEVGASSLTEAVKKHFKISTAEAEKIKEENGIRKDKKNVDLFFSFISTLSVLKDEINKLVAYWESHRERYTAESGEIKKVILYGKESALQGFSEYLSAGLELSVELANVWVNVSSLEDYLPPINFKESLSYATVIGLALNSHG